MTKLFIVLTQHDDAAGTNGGSPFFNMTVVRENREPLTSFTIRSQHHDNPDPNTDNDLDQITVTDTHGTTTPAHFLSHICCACMAWDWVTSQFSAMWDGEFYSDAFGDKGEIAWEIN